MIFVCDATLGMSLLRRWSKVFFQSCDLRSNKCISSKELQETFRNRFRNSFRKSFGRAPWSFLGSSLKALPETLPEAVQEALLKAPKKEWIDCFLYRMLEALLTCVKETFQVGHREQKPCFLEGLQQAVQVQRMPSTSASWMHCFFANHPWLWISTIFSHWG